MHLHDSLPDLAVPYAPFHSRRSVVYSAKGMVACSQPLAAEAGRKVLALGGNAADAAVAVSAALNLTEPGSCGIGGDAFCLYYDAKTGEVKALNGSGRAPAALTLEKVRELGVEGREIPFLNINSVTVPGCAAAWVDTLEHFGSGKLTMADVLEPAISMAENGIPISEVSSYSWVKNHDVFLKQSPNGAEMLITDPATGKTHSPRPGEIFKNPTLAKTFRAVAEEGKKGFYEGRIAEAIVELIQSKGGVMTLEDLKNHTTTPVTPISINYGGEDGVTLHETPPNGQGLTALIALGILEAMQEQQKVDLSKTEHLSAEWFHALICAIRLAFADTRAYIADPEHSRVPVEELLSKEYLSKRAELFDPTKSTPIINKGTPIASSDTVLFEVADAEGNAVSYIQSNYAGFGTYAVPKGCGFTLQNRGCNFTLEEGHPNCIAPNKRPYHTIIPALVTRGNKKGGDLFMSYGVMGGFMQPQGHVQILLNMLHHGANAQTTLDAPRFCISADVPKDRETAGDIGTLVYLEEGVKPEVVEELKRMGHDVELLSGHARSQFGRGQVIQKLSSGAWAGGSDPRGDGHAVPQI
ncbi:lincomycin-condensing protein lmbA [Leucosporidium creatinivorum]|uniref:Lincomycin-condensing protein lmbA n=1 Tax=Leucosporidium creatinivorum TaxID=106004 RepID=A0A1Y2FHS2_9BASI|nr:lincomycin-condensing protein lmbA [Leucosporidium creatinivorum]